MADDDAETNVRTISAIRRTERKQRATQILAARLAGLSYAQIGERFGISADTARRSVEENLSRTTAREAAELRQVENQRLDRAQAAIWSKVVAGDLDAVRVFVRISERRSKLNGLDAPQQVDVGIELREEMESALRELRRCVLDGDQGA